MYSKVHKYNNVYSQLTKNDVSIHVTVTQVKI